MCQTRDGQAPPPDLTNTQHRSERLGPLPLINTFLERLQLKERLNRFVPSNDPRLKIANTTSLGVLLRSLLVEREPIYRQAVMVGTFASDAFGSSHRDAQHFSDDALGRALDRLRDSDRAALLSDVVVAATHEFSVKLDELHNDATNSTIDMTTTPTPPQQHALDLLQSIHVQPEPQPIKANCASRASRPTLRPKVADA